MNDMLDVQCKFPLTCPDIHLACAASPDFLLIFLKLPQKGSRKGHIWNMSTSQFMNKHVGTICLRHYFNF